jgi:C-terminal processing protease CtpA/Prc
MLSKLFIRLTSTILLVLIFFCATAQQKIENLATFARLYGYVRFFHPSDEANSIDWTQFAIYGSKKVENCNSTDQLLDTLKRLFLPIAPTILLFKKEENKRFDINSISSSADAKYMVSWQHLGVNLGYKGGNFNSDEYVYKSVRTNRGDSILFLKQAKIGDYINKEIGNDIEVIIPIALWGTFTYTVPQASANLLAGLKQSMNKFIGSKPSADSLYTRLGAVIITWNVFQHFYPYLSMTATGWDSDLRESLNQAYLDTTALQFQATLKKLTQKLKDGHIRVYDLNDPATSFPPFYWEWIENQLAITRIIDTSVGLRKGDIVTKVNGTEPKLFFDSLKVYISAATSQFQITRAQTESLIGVKKSILNLSVSRGPISFDTKIERTINIISYLPAAIDTRDTIKMISEGITYLNLSTASISKIDSSISELQKSKVIICDLRGYPNGNHKFLEYLLKAKDTNTSWMQIPQYIYPDQENIAGYQKKGSELDAKQPHLAAKIFCLIDSRCISYAESVVAIMQHYKLATLVGQPTGGTNGNINILNLPGGYLISWTGMNVLKLDGSLLHGVGILPDIYARKTIKGVIEGRDEVLEKAIAVAENFIKNGIIDVK